MAPSIGLLIKNFFPIIKTRITGSEHMQAPAINSPQSVSSLNEPLNIARPTARVLMLSVLVIIKGQIKLFHVVTNVNMLKEAIAGVAQGSAILKNV